MVGVCHLLLGRFVRPGDLVAGPGWRIPILVVGLAWFAFLVVPAAPWAPLELVVRLAICWWGLRRRSRTAVSGPTLAEVICEPVPPRHLARLAALPVAAAATHAALLALDPSEQAVRTNILEPLVATQTLLGWALFLAALVSVRRSGSDTNSRVRVR